MLSRRNANIPSQSHFRRLQVSLWYVKEAIIGGKAILAATVSLL